MEEVFKEALNLLEKGQQFVIATVVGTKGSTPQKPGAKLLVREDGTGAVSYTHLTLPTILRV